MFDEAKFTELVVHVASRLADDRPGGASKLARALYFVDFAHVRRHGRPLTGATYVRASGGPVPRELRGVRDRLVAAGEGEVVIEDFLGHDLQRLVALRDADLSGFTADELAVVDRIVDDLAGLTGVQVDVLASEEFGVRTAGDGDEIPYASATIARRQVPTPVGRRLAADVAHRYGIAVPA